MRALRILAMAAPLFAQQQAPPPGPTPSGSTATTAGGEAAPPASDANWLTGSIDLGYRWQTGVGGSLDTYRSLVNLGSGPKLIGADFTIADPKRRFFDRILVRAYGWGGEPYETFHASVKKARLYEFNADYRDLAYFNYLPSYADPLLSMRGIALNEQAFDTRRRTGSFSLDLLPANWIVPYFAYDKDSGSGTGTTVLVSGADEFAVPNTMSDRTNLFRGGVRIERKRFHVTLEEGRTTFRDNQTLYQATGVTNSGNLTTPFFGQPIDLASLVASYGIRGTGVYTKALFTAGITSWLDLYGHFLYSQPKTNVDYQHSASGGFVLQSELLFYNSEQYLVSAVAQSPHTAGSFGAEIRPFRRVRIVESWLTDRLHVSGGASTNQVLTGQDDSTQKAALLSSSLATNYNQQEIDLFYDPTSKLMLRGGYRYVWGDANDAILPAAGLAGAERGGLSRNVGIGGVTFRPNPRTSVSGTLEAASSTGAYFRTSLYDYRKIRVQARYQAAASLNLSMDFTLLKNHVPGVNYDYLAHQESLSFLWAPGSGKKWDFQGSYTRSTIYSDIGYLDPGFLTPLRSTYRDNAHIATALFSANLPDRMGLAPKITAGGSLFLSSGSRPTNYYQPFAKVLLPVNRKLSWFAEWTYYGYGEAFYLYEGFRSNLVMTGFRLTQ